jgi:hypothetical protein
VIKAIGLVKYANGVTVTKTLREVTGQSLVDCKHMCDILHDGGKDILHPEIPVKEWIEIVPRDGRDRLVSQRLAVNLLIRAGVTLLVDDTPVLPTPEIDLLRREMRIQVEHMATMLGGVVSWTEDSSA